MRNFYVFFKKIGLGQLIYEVYLVLANAWNTALFAHNLKRKKSGRIVVYHRIADVKKDPHHLCVKPEIFRDHLLYFLENYEIISLEKLANRAGRAELSGNEMSITFDDGYKDNLEVALPLLEKYQIPATIFVATGNLGKPSDFSWDNGYEEGEKGFFLTKEEIYQMSRHPLITIGAHTCTHPNLAGLDSDQQQREINEGRITLEEIIRQEVKIFAFPFGGPLSYTKNTVNILKTEGFRLACTTIENLVTANTNQLLLPRFNMRSYTKKELAAKLGK